MGVYQGLIVEVISKLLLKPALVCKAGGIENDAQRLHKRNVGFVFLADNLHYEKFPDGSMKCVEEEIPFEVPSGWEWTRLGSISSIITDYVANGSFASLKSNVKTYKERNYALFVRTVDFATDFKQDLSYIDKESYDFLEKSKLFGGELMLSNIGASIGKVFKVPYFNIPMSLAPNAIILRFLNDITNDYFEYVFKSFIGQDYLQHLSSGAAMPKFNKTDLRQMIAPIPPLREQDKIVNVIRSVFTNIDNFDYINNDIKTAIKIIKSKILDLAIRGKLVPQDPNDEPASALLERIRAEKEELIKQGKIKRDKGEGIIFKDGDNSHYEKIGDKVTCIDDEIPFEVPEMWAWARLSNIAEITMGSSPAGENICNDKKYLEFHQGKISFKEKIIGYSGQHTKEITKVAKPNSVLLCVRAPVGEVNITNREICIGRGLSAIHPYLGMEAEFMFYWLQPFKQFLNGKATGSTFSAITSEVVRNLLIPLPPISEQKRIVEAVTSAFSLISKIEESLA